MDEKDRTIQALTDLVNALTESNKALKDTITELQDTIKELQRRLGQNSQNSSKPPSSDGFKKPNPKSLRQKSGKKPGGQKGHAGKNMQLPHDPDNFKQHMPSRCLLCTHFAECVESGHVFSCAEKRYEVNAEVKTVVTEHQMVEVEQCPCTGESLTGRFPDHIKAYIQYGDSVTVLAGILNTYGAVSVNRIHVILSSLLNVSLSCGTISSMVSRCSKVVGPVMEKIRKLISGGAVAHFDETGSNVNGKTFWTHSSSTARLTYQTVNKKRGKQGMDANGVLPDFRGIAMHDCWAPYWRYDGLIHAICNIHLLRELAGVEEFSPDHSWPKEFRELLIAMKKAREKAIRKGLQELSDYYMRKFNSMYDQILNTAEKECPLPPDVPKKKGRKKKGKERALIERLRKLKEAVCMFIHDFRVPFGNNQAEQDVRNVKTKIKVSGCFRTEGGAQDYLNIMSYLSTARKGEVGVFEALQAAFSGNAEIVLP